MNILVAHNYYSLAGGEDDVFKEECELLKRNGHNVITYQRSNDEWKKLPFFDQNKYQNANI